MKSARRRASATQMRLSLGGRPALDRAGFIVSRGNEEALAALDAWRDWPGGRLALVGPEGAGKTHLASIWRSLSGARATGGLPALRLPGGPVLLEDADRPGADEALFHLINRAEAGDALLLTARTAPRDWPVVLPDLRSRLNATRTILLAPPDDIVLEGLLREFFRLRNIRPEPDVIAYLVRRIERSAPAAWGVVERIDDAADAGGREITRALAREVLEGGPGSLDLFD